jgi:hypothetical protein
MTPVYLVSKQTGFLEDSAIRRNASAVSHADRVGLCACIMGRHEHKKLPS